MTAKIVVTTPWHDRPNYLRIMLSTLREAMRGHDSPHLLFVHNNQFDLPEVVSGFSTVTALSSRDCHQVYVDIMNTVFKNTDADYVLNIDADAIVHPLLINAAKLMVSELDDIGHASFFNESCHPESQNYHKEIYTIRQHISFFCSMVRREAWQMFTPPAPGQEFRFGCADGMFSTFVTESTPFKVYCTVRSYAEHLGFNGAHSGETPDGLCLSPRGRRFYP